MSMFYKLQVAVPPEQGAWIEDKLQAGAHSKRRVMTETIELVQRLDEALAPLLLFEGSIEKVPDAELGKEVKALLQEYPDIIRGHR